MLTKYNLYEYRKVKGTDAFADLSNIGLARVILIRFRKGKLSFVANKLHVAPFCKEMLEKAYNFTLPFTRRREER